MPSEAEELIRGAADNARSILSQLGPLAWALHVMRQPAGAFAVCVDREPDKYVEIRTTETEPKRDKRKRKVVRVLEDLRSRRGMGEAGLFESRGYRAAVNRSIVVYGVGALEGFVLDSARACRPDLDLPTDTLEVVSRLKGRGIDLQHVCHYANTAWLVLVRNAIVHNGGKASKRTIGSATDCKYAVSPTPGWKATSAPGEAGPLAWTEVAGEAAGDDWVGREFAIPIDEFVLPRLADAQAFVGEAEGEFVRHLQGLSEAGSRRPLEGIPAVG